MNEAYRYKDGNVIITGFIDNEATKEIRPYQDNIDKILINENIIEWLNSFKNAIIFDIEDNKYHIDCGKTCIKVSIPIIIASTIVLGIIFNMILSNIMQSGILSLLTTSTVFGKILIYDQIKQTKQSKKIIEVNEIELQEIEKEIEKVLKETQELEQCKEKVKEEEIKKDSSYRQLNYVEKLKKIREYLEMILLYEMCKEELSTYDEQGILEEKLKDELDSSKMKTLRKIINTKQYKTNEF